MMDSPLVLRRMEPGDVEPICRAEAAQGWHAAPDKYFTRLRHQQAGLCVSLTALWDGCPAGYINLYFSPQDGPFVGQSLCEIVDFGVLEKYQRRGIGSALMDAAERIAAQRSDRVCLGVGLHSGYGCAQRMYAKRGYVPDGSGVWYGDAPCPPYTACQNDDDLVLYWSKHLG
ncbi:MAG: GNAT family N-acetyltransferase [Eubacteriales bacterium]|nr:GNAT family N-acetyltransferase [Eubacteriales bacterium]